MKYLKVIFVLVCFVFFSCKKETVDTNNSGSLNFSNDTITFDTVFASVGSITKILKVYNNNENDIYTDIELKGVSSANFRINIDGVPSNSLNNVNIPSKDSIFIFIEVMYWLSFSDLVDSKVYKYFSLFIFSFKIIN